MERIDIGDSVVLPNATAERVSRGNHIFWTHRVTTHLIRRAFSESYAAKFLNHGANLRLISAALRFVQDVGLFTASAWHEMLVNRRHGLKSKFADFDRRLQAAMKRVPPQRIDVAGLALQVLGTRFVAKGNTAQLADILCRGDPVLVVASHTYAPIDGLMLMSMVHRFRTDYSMLVNAGNALISAIPEYDFRFIPVELSEGLIRNADIEIVKKSRIKALRLAHRRLAVDGACVILFPAGRVSRATAWDEPIVDSEWLDGAAFLVRKLANRGSNLHVLPCFVDTHLGGASASQRYHAAHFNRPSLLPAALMEAALNPPPTIDINVGNALPARILQDMAADELTRVLRAKVYALAPTIPVATRGSSPEPWPTSSKTRPT